MRSEARRVITQALKGPGVTLSNNCLAELLGRSVVVVRHVRRELEAAGSIPGIYERQCLRGFWVDVRRTVENKRAPFEREREGLL